MRRVSQRKRGFRLGFSLLEVLFVMAVLVAVSGAVFTLFNANNFASIVSGDEGAAMAETQKALRSITADLISGSAFETPTSTGGIRVVFPSEPAVEYYQDGSELKHVVPSTGDPATTVVTGLATGIGLSLTYYDAGMNAIAGPMDSTKYGQASAVDVTVTIDLDHSVFGQIIRTTRVVLRNKVS